MSNLYFEEPIMSIFKNLFSSTDKLCTSIFTGVLAIFAPVWVPITTVAFIMIIDAIYGYKVSKKYGQPKIESRKAYKTFWKIRDAIVTITGAHVIDTFIVTSINLHAVEFVAGMVALIEFWSLLESMCELHPKWKLWKVLKRVLKAKGEKYLDVKLDDVLTDDTSNISNC